MGIIKDKMAALILFLIFLMMMGIVGLVISPVVTIIILFTLIILGFILLVTWLFYRAFINDD